RLEELDRIAGRLVEHDLGATRPGADVTAEAQAGRPEPAHLCGEILDHELDAVPASRDGLPAVGQAPTARARLPAEQQPEIVASDRHERWHCVGLDDEAEVGRVEADRGTDVVNDVPDVGRSHEKGSPPESDVVTGAYCPARHPRSDRRGTPSAPAGSGHGSPTPSLSSERRPG